MTLQEQINKDLKEAMLSKDEAKKSLLRVVIGELSRGKNKVFTDEIVIAQIKKMIENTKLVPTNTSALEATILETYLPKQLTEDQLKMLIAQLVEDKNYTSIKDMGKIMNDLKNEFGGQYDGKIASTLIKNHFTITV